MEFIEFLQETSVIFGLIIGTILFVFMFYIIHQVRSGCDQETAKIGKSEKKKEQLSNNSKQQQQHKKKNVDNRWVNRIDKHGFTHPWLLTNFKGHTGQILDLDFSSNGKYLASCGEDRAVFLWDTRDLTQKDHKSLRINIEYDHPTFVKWSPDCKAFIINKYNENTVEVYKVDKKKDGWLGHATKALTFPKLDDCDIIGMGIANNGKFIMTCSNKTDLVVWDLKGQILAQVDTYLMSTTCAKISPCSRFVVASGFAPDAKIWEVNFGKTGEFVDVKRVFELTGHSSGVYDVAFDVDSSHMATVSKDGTWKLFGTKIEYKKGEDPHLKASGKYEQSGNYAKIALAPNADVIVIAASNGLQFFCTQTGKLDFLLENVFSGPITGIVFDSLGKYLLACGDKQIRVFHNVTGYKCEIEAAKEKLKQNQTSATKERLQKLIAANSEFLRKISLK